MIHEKHKNKIIIPIKALSINACFQGRRFKTKECKQYDRDLQLLLPKMKIEAEFYAIRYKFYINTFKGSDLDNLIKVLQDNLAAKGIIRDDRYITQIWAEKIESKQNKIEIEIYDAESIKF
jgi:Holliday junction resolvase RusA-like endonuclease